MDIKQIINQIQDKFGEDSVMSMNDSSLTAKEFISTRSLLLDRAISGKDKGGFPTKRITEIYGAEASGKTTLCLQACAEVQKAGKIPAYIDVEHALDTEYCEALGIDLENIVISQPDSGESALNLVASLLDVPEIGIIIVDSVASLLTKSEIDGEHGDQFVGIQARFMSQSIKKLTPKISNSNSPLVFINQLRSKVQTFGFGSPDTTSGGRALKYYSSVRIELKNIGQIKNGETVIGNKIMAKVTKNKVASPFGTCTLELVYGKGFEANRELLDMAIERGLITKKGAWFNYGEISIGQGKEKAVEYLNNTPKVLNEIKKAIN